MDDRFADERKFKSSLDDFSVLFHEDQVYFGERAYPTGQCVVDILNIEEEELSAIDQALQDVYHAIQRVWKENTESSVQIAQEKMHEVWTLVSRLPVYRDMHIDWSQPISQNADLVKTFWTVLRKIPVKKRAEVGKQLRSLTGMMDFLRVFRKEIMQIVDAYLEPVQRRNSEAYAAGIYRFYSDMETAGRETRESPPEHSFPVQVKFVPMESPTVKGKIILAEQTRFSGLTGLISFLQVEFYRGLTVGNAPRKCHNCGKYFLLTAGYNTCYCNNVAPGETVRTCRKVGAHQKALRRNSERTQAQREYYRLYNRLKQRKNRGQLDDDEWNAIISRAREMANQVERGEMTYEELVEQFSLLKGTKRRSEIESG